MTATSEDPATFTPGQLVGVDHVHGVGGDFLLPGEDIYVIEYRKPSYLSPTPRVRVRCPASGVDCWVDPDVLHPRTSEDPSL